MVLHALAGSSIREQGAPLKCLIKYMNLICCIEISMEIEVCVVLEIEPIKPQQPQYILGKILKKPY